MAASEYAYGEDHEATFDRPRQEQSPRYRTAQLSEEAFGDDPDKHFLVEVSDPSRFRHAADDERDT